MMTQEQKPTVGRIVHYIAFGTPGREYPAGVHRAAVITQVEDFIDPGCRVGLCILNPTGMFFNQSVRFDESGTTPGTWHWPERQEPEKEYQKNP